MSIATETLQKAEEQAQREWDAWQAEHHARREAKGYNEPVSDDEALDILG